MVEDPRLFNKLYSGRDPPPWTFTEPPDELVDVAGKITPCKTLSIGCGEGYFEIYLASNGFDVIGIDISGKAIELAKKHAKERNANLEFIQMNWRDMNQLPSDFEFVFDWRFLHEILTDDDRQKYITSIAKILKTGGKYLSSSLSDKSDYAGTDKIRTTPAGTTLYFASEEDIKKLLDPHFKILEYGDMAVPVTGIGDKPSYCVFAEKK